MSDEPLEPKTFEDLWMMRETSNAWFDGQVRYENVRKGDDPAVGMVDSVSWHVAPSSDRVRVVMNTHVICEVRSGGRSLSCRIESKTVDEYRSMEALLALADEMEFDGAGALDDGDWCKPLLVEYARRIREALGLGERDAQ